MAPLYGWSSTVSWLKPLWGGSLLFSTKFSTRNSWYSYYWPQKDDRLRRSWSHPMVLNTGPLDWESSALTTGFLYTQIQWLNDPIKPIQLISSTERKCNFYLKRCPSLTFSKSCQNTNTMVFKYSIIEFVYVYQVNKLVKTGILNVLHL